VRIFSSRASLLIACTAAGLFLAARCGVALGAFMASHDRASLADVETVVVIALQWVFLAMAVAIACSRSSSQRARVLVLNVACVIAWTSVAPGAISSPWPAVGAVVAALYAILGSLLMPLLVAFVSLFGEPLSPVRRACAIAAYTIDGIGAVMALASAIVPTQLDSLVQILIYASAALCTGLAFAAALRPERRIALIALLPIAVFQIAAALAYVVELIGLDPAASPAVQAARATGASFVTFCLAAALLAGQRGSPTANPT
jgi:hypothetical protein